MNDMRRPDHAIEAAVDFDVSDVDDQEITIQVVGPDVLLIEGYVQDPDANPHAVMPDWVQVFVHAANLGMLSGANCLPWESAARIIDKKFDRVGKSANWKVALNGIDRGAFRVLRNLLRANLLERVVVRTLNPPLHSAKVHIDALAYPSAYSPAPFPVNSEWTPRPLRDRSIQITFAHNLGPELVETSYTALRTWTTLLLLGGYPAPRFHPRVAAVTPDEAYQLDAFTIAQEFPELFQCDEACFSAVVNWAQGVHRSTCPLEMIQIE